MKLMRSKNKDSASQEELASPYVKAQEEWSLRIGNAKTQLINWQLIGLGSIITCVILLIALIVMVGKHQEYVYVAQVQPNENVVNTVSLSQPLSPSQAQKAYFISGFINDIMNIPLDPVIARNNWLDAYTKVDGQAVTQLTNYAQSVNPLANLGSQTSSVQITNFNALSDNSIQFNWTTTSYDAQGQVLKQTTYSGLFTVKQGNPPTDEKGILSNPFGLKIVYFSMNSED